MSSTSSWRSRLNAPRPIFLGWTAMIFVAGYSYYHVKVRNLQKRKDIMRREAVSSSSSSDSGDLKESGDLSKGAEGHERDHDEALARHLAQQERRDAHASASAQSPLQSLLAQLNKQTTQRSRASREG